LHIKQLEKAENKTSSYLLGQAHKSFSRATLPEEKLYALRATVPTVLGRI